MNFKAYSEKSKARRALVQAYGMDKDATDPYLTQVDGKHGFYLETLGEQTCPVQAAAVQAATVTTTIGEPRTVEADALPTEADVQALAPQGDDEQHEEEHHDDAAGNGAFGAFAMAQLTAPSNATPVEPPRVAASQRIAGLKIEKDREERNGVKMPSVGGMCRAVWDALNNLMTHDEATGLANVPTVADIKALAEEKGWNVNNASIEYYQWRKFHGISGRGKKQI